MGINFTSRLGRLAECIASNNDHQKCKVIELAVEDDCVAQLLLVYTFLLLVVH